ncbi:MAG: ATP-binding cassette domain-containing protein, partial [Acidobacteria bacterium]|nr:ATP-binding cassette domain-containing protein [Acidobacteriota bacterium]
GEIHALVGENGAGKSTLMKVLGGVYPYPQYGGEISLDGETRRFGSVRDAEAAGIAVIYQELSLIKDLSIGENIFLGREPRRFGVIRWEDLYSRAQKLLDELHLATDPRTPVGNLGIGQQQLVEIAKALSQEARILVLDEPTAALTDAEVETLFRILKRLRERGVGMIYISHKLDEVFRMSDRITVLRDGRTVGTEPTSALDERRVIARMVGREVGDIFPQADHERGDVVFEVRDMTVEDPNVKGKLLVNKVSFSVRRGEVLGVAGLMGAKANSVFTIAGTLSGGNQQKVVLAKWLLTNPRVLFLDEPTRGIDVGAKQEIYAQINNLARAGLAIVLVSSELPEVLGLSDRVLVLHEGRVTGEFKRTEATPEAVMACATGHAQRAA